jgi:hypothetical protein
MTEPVEVSDLKTLHHRIEAGGVSTSSSHRRSLPRTPRARRHRDTVTLSGLPTDSRSRSRIQVSIRVTPKSHTAAEPHMRDGAAPDGLVQPRRLHLKQLGDFLRGEQLVRRRGWHADQSGKQRGTKS